MFCPSCAGEIRDGLRFCNHCGAQIIKDASAPPRVLGLIWLFVIATVIVAVSGFGIVFMLAREFAERGNILGSSLLLLAVLTVGVLIVVSLLGRQISRLLSVYLTQGEPTPNAKQKALNAPKTRNLAEPLQPTARLNAAQTTNPNLVTTEEMTRNLEREKEATRRFNNDE